MMPLQPDTIQINLFGLDQKADPRALEPGKLERADNVEVIKAPALSLRRGYRRVNLDRTADNTDIRANGDLLFHRLVVFRNRLLVIGHTRVFAVTFPINTITVTGGTTSITDRGRVARCGVRSRVISTGERSGALEIDGIP